MILVAVGALVTRLQYKAGGSLGEDGNTFALAAHLLDGRIPYRTLLGPRPPGAYAFDALVMAAAGRTLGAQHLAAFISGQIVYPLLVYAAARALRVRPAIAFVAGLCVSLFAVPVPGLPLGCALVALVLAARWIGSGAPGALFASGVAAGAEAAFSLGASFSALAAVALTIGVRALSVRRTGAGTTSIPTRQPLFILATGAAVGVTPFLIALGLDRGLGTFLRYLPVLAEQTVRASAFPAPSGGAVRFYLPLLALPPLAALLARAARDEALRPRALVALLLTFSTTLRLMGATAAGSEVQLAASLAEAPLLAAWLAEWAAARRGRISLPRLEASFALGIGLVCSASWRLAAQRPLVALVPAAAALLVAGAGLGRRQRADSRAGVRITAPAMVLALGSFVGLLSPGRLAGGASGVPVLGALWPPALAGEMAGAVRVLQAAAPKDGAVFVYPSAGLLYELAGRRNPTSFTSLDSAAAAWEVRRVLDELTADQPEAVLVRYRQAGAWSRSLSPVTSLLEEQYVETRRFDRPELWGIWVRREGAEVCRRLVLHAFDHPRSGAGLSPVRTVKGREQPELVQRAPAARFRLDLDRGSYVRFSVDPSSQEPQTARGIDVVAQGDRLEVWRGGADGARQRIVLPLVEALRGEVVLRSPRGRTTVWTDPMVCSSR